MLIYARNTFLITLLICNYFNCRTNWLSTTGSPGCKIERCELTNWQNLTRPEFRGFSIRF